MEKSLKNTIKNYKKDKSFFKNLLKVYSENLRDKNLIEIYRLGYNGQEYLETNLLKALEDKIVSYVYCEKEIKDGEKKFKNVAERNKYHVDLFRKAVAKYCSQDNSGDFGELILFLFLESYRSAIQIVNKMRLRDAALPHRGFDNIHLSYKNNKILLYIGESKTKSCGKNKLQTYISNCVDDGIKSLKEYLEKDNENNCSNQNKKDFQFNHISDNLYKEKFSDKDYKIIKETIDKRFNPYSSQIDSGLEDYEKIYVIFVCYEIDKLKEFLKNGDDIKVFEKHLKEECFPHIKTKVIKIIEDESLKHHKIEFIFLPFKNISEFRRDFQDKLKI